MSTTQYGNKYFCVKVAKDISSDGEIYLMADDTRITGNGTVEFIKKNGDEISVNLSIAHGKWFVFFAASLFDGHAVAVEYWKDEIVNPFENKEDKKSNGRQNKERDKMSKSIRYDVMRRDKFKCKLCGANGGEYELEIDHIIPVSKGGKTELDNLQTLCKNCNRGKRDKLC